MNFFLRLVAVLLLIIVSAPTFSQDAGSVGPSAADSPVVVALPSNLYGRTEGGVPAGIVAEVVDTVLTRMNRAHHCVDMRTTDAIQSLKEGKVGVIAVLNKTSGTQSAGLFTAPIITEYNVVVVRKGEKFQMSKVEYLSERNFGIRASNPYQHPNNGFANLKRYESKGDILRSLILGRIDAAIISSLSDIYDFRTEGIMSKVDILDRAVGTVPIHAVLSKDAFSQEDLESFNRHLAALQQEPLWNTISERNGFGDLLHKWPLVDE